MNEEQAGKNAVWQKTPYANLVRYVPSGKYFARLRVHGKLIRRCLKTNKSSVAKIRLADLEKLERQRVETHGAISNGTMTFGDALAIFQQRMQGDGSLKPRSKEYRSERIAALLRSWENMAQKVTFSEKN